MPQSPPPTPPAAPPSPPPAPPRGSYLSPPARPPPPSQLATAVGIFFAYKGKRLTKDEAQISCTNNVVM